VLGERSWRIDAGAPPAAAPPRNFRRG
jgi:hypothetical protein